MKSVRVRCPAKVNLFLRVLSRRPDGYHDLETVFQAVSLFDELVIRETKSASSLCVPGHPELGGPDNLVWKAARWVCARTGFKTGFSLQLTKRIPTAAGLGGGSSDAAGCLLGLRALFDLALSDYDIYEAATMLGADVPFFLAGGTAVGERKGEKLTPIDLPQDYRLFLVNPGLPVSTAEVFRLYDTTLTSGARQAKLWAILANRPGVTELLHNDLQPVAESLCPVIACARRALSNATHTAALVSGSGPTVFSVVSGSEEHRIFEDPPSQWTVFFVAPIPGGAIFD